MQKDQTDQELNFKKQARRRLVGAVALVLVMVIVLPMLLKDRVASEPAEKITITLPNETSPAVKTPSDFDSNIVPAESATTATAEPSVSHDVTAEESNESAKTEKVPEAKPTTLKKQAEVGKLTQVPENASPVVGDGKYYVQIGVFSDMGNVKQLQLKLKALGYQSQTEKIKTDKGEKTRLRTILFNSRNDAAVALENIKNAGISGMVVSQK